MLKHVLLISIYLFIYVVNILMIHITLQRATEPNDYKKKKENYKNQSFYSKAMQGYRKQCKASRLNLQTYLYPMTM